MSQMKQAEDINGILKAFNSEPLKKEDLPDFYYPDTMENRMGDEWLSPIKRIFQACMAQSNRNAHLFLGHKGCGKSTELVALKKDFEEVGHSVHLVYSEMERDLRKITNWDMMLLITEGLCKIAYKREIALPHEPLEAIYGILKRDMQVTEITSSSASIDVTAGANASTPALLSGLVKLFVSLNSTLKASTNRQETVTVIMNKKSSDWLMYTKEIAAYITDGCSGKQPIIIIEDLDKLPDPTLVFNLLGDPALSQMPFPVIYTFPISQCYASQYAAIRASYAQHTLPMIKLRNLDKSRNDMGFSVIRNIVAKRAKLELFDDIDETGDVLDLLIKKTGGVLRHLFECIVTAAYRASWRGETTIAREDAERALDEQRKELTRLITKSMNPDLKGIHNNPLDREQINNSKDLLSMMHSLVVLEYENGERWHNLHPLIADFLVRLGEIEDYDKQT